MYSKIPLLRFACDQTCAKLSNIPDYQMLPLLTLVFTGIFLVRFLWLGAATNQRIIHLDVSLICWFRVITVLFYIFQSLCS